MTPAIVPAIKYYCLLSGIRSIRGRPFSQSQQRIIKRLIAYNLLKRCSRQRANAHRLQERAPNGSGATSSRLNRQDVQYPPRPTAPAPPPAPVRDNVEVVLLQHLLSEVESHNDSCDEFYYFGLFIAATLRKMPHQIACRAMLRIQQILNEALDNMDDGNYAGEAV